jgi:hypothetical protein
MNEKESSGKGDGGSGEENPDMNGAKNSISYPTRDEQTIGF